MRTDTLQRIQGISVDLAEAVPNDAEIIRTTSDGNLIVEEMLPRFMVEGKKAKRVRTDDEGNEVWKTNQNGEDITKVHEWDTDEIKVRYKLEARRTGKAVRNYDYETSEEEMRRERVERERENFMDELAEEAVQHGISARELLVRLARGDNPLEEEEEASEPSGELEGPSGEMAVSEPDLDSATGDIPENYKSSVSAGGETAYMVGPGTWKTSYGETYLKKKKEEMKRILEARDEEANEAMSHMRGEE